MCIRALAASAFPNNAHKTSDRVSMLVRLTRNCFLESRAWDCGPVLNGKIHCTCCLHTVAALKPGVAQDGPRFQRLILRSMTPGVSRKSAADRGCSAGTGGVGGDTAVATRR